MKARLKQTKNTKKAKKKNVIKETKTQRKKPYVRV